MTHLRKKMLEELERRNYSPSTTRAYLRAVEDFARFFKRSPDQLGPDHIRQYQAYLFRERKLEPNTVIQHLGGIRFFYIKTLKQSWSADLTPYPKKVLHLPSVLSREEVNSLIEAAPTPFQRTPVIRSASARRSDSSASFTPGTRNFSIIRTFTVLFQPAVWRRTIRGGLTHNKDSSCRSMFSVKFFGASSWMA